MITAICGARAACCLSRFPVHRWSLVQTSEGSISATSIWTIAGAYVET